MNKFFLSVISLMMSVRAEPENYGYCSNKQFRQVSYKSADCTGEVDQVATDKANEEWEHQDWGGCREYMMYYINYQCSGQHFKTQISTEKTCTQPLGEATLYKWGDCTNVSATSSYKYTYTQQSSTEYFLNYLRKSWTKVVGW